MYHPSSCVHFDLNHDKERTLQITAIIFMPSFPGWLAPMHFNPVRFEEFLSFAITVCGTWVGAAWLVGGYKSNATSGMLFPCKVSAVYLRLALMAFLQPLHAA